MKTVHEGSSGQPPVQVPARIQNQARDPGKVAAVDARVADDNAKMVPEVDNAKMIPEDDNVEEDSAKIGKDAINSTKDNAEEFQDATVKEEFQDVDAKEFRAADARTAYAKIPKDADKNQVWDPGGKLKTIVIVSDCRVG